MKPDQAWCASGCHRWWGVCRRAPYRLVHRHTQWVWISCLDFTPSSRCRGTVEEMAIWSSVGPKLGRTHLEVIAPLEKWCCIHTTRSLPIICYQNMLIKYDISLSEFIQTSFIICVYCRRGMVKREVFGEELIIWQLFPLYLPKQKRKLGHLFKKNFFKHYCLTTIMQRGWAWIKSS